MNFYVDTYIDKGQSRSNKKPCLHNAQMDIHGHISIKWLVPLANMHQKFFCYTNPINHVNFKWKKIWTKQLDTESVASHRRGAKVDHDIWPHAQNWRAPLLIINNLYYIWSLKVIRQKLWAVSCPQGLISRVPKLTLTFNAETQNE